MSVTEDEIYRYIQDVFQRGLVVVVGSGASCAQGLPGMGELADHLTAEMARRSAALSAEARLVWDAIEANIARGADLESAFDLAVIPRELSEMVTSLVAERIAASEARAIDEIVRSASPTAFSRLFSHVLRTGPVVDLVTTNYDRLLEVHAASGGIPVDTLFYGHTVGRFDAKRSHDEVTHLRASPGKPRSVMAGEHPHVRLSKPHGSLDWFSHEDTHYRSDLPISGARRIIAPGATKYRLGYEAPFDAHRNRANEAIDRAAAMLFIGYGFNDEHLQTHIRPRFAQVPAVVLSKELTGRALEYLALNDTAIGIDGGAGPGCSRVVRGSETAVLSKEVWDLAVLLEEVVGI